MNNSKHYFKSLTGIRAIAAIMVFLYHNRKYWRNDLPMPVMRLLSEFHTGVTLFFVLSGFLLAYRYKDEPLGSFKEYAKYLLLRVARIYPLYWLLLTAFFIDQAYGSKVTTYYLHYSLLYPLFNTYVLTGISQAWSLSVEMFFYLFSPLLFLLLKKNLAKALLFLLALLGLAWGIGFSLHRASLNPHDFLYPLNFILGNTFFGRSLEFFAGMYLAYLMQQKTQLLSGFKLRYVTLAGSALFIITIGAIALFAKNNFVHGVETWPGRLLHETLLPVSVAIMFYGLLTEATLLSKFLSTKFMVLLGNASFAFYLIHISYFNLKLKELFFLPDNNFVVLWLCSIAIFMWIEKPLYELCRKWVAKI
ncbi:MAG: acyltransferase [Bacteroidota bacterium]